MNFDTSLTNAFASLSVSSPSESAAVPDSAASPFQFSSTAESALSRSIVSKDYVEKEREASTSMKSHRVALRLLGTVIYDAAPCLNKSLVNVIVEYGCEGPEFYFEEGHRLLDIGRESDAYKHFSEAALYHNHHFSQREAAKILLSGKDIGFIPTRDDALSLMRKAASHSDAYEDRILLAIELEKSGLQEHDKEAVKLYTEASDPDNACYRLGRMIFEGRAQTASFQENMRAAISLLQSAAQVRPGDDVLEAPRYANMLLAHIYATQKNLGLQNPKESDDLAFNCLLSASSRGFPEAQLLLTCRYVTGKGCPDGVDLSKARSWCLQASKAGWGPQDDASVFIAKYLLALPTEEEKAFFLKSFLLPHIEFHSRLFVEGSHNKIVKCFFEREPVLLEVIDLSQLGEALKTCRSSPDYLGITWNIELLDSSCKRVKLPLVKVKRLTTAKPDDPMPQ